MRLIAWHIVLMVLYANSFALCQNVDLKVDSTSFLIGDQAALHLTATLSDASANLVFLRSTLDTASEIEFVRENNLYKETSGGQTVYSKDFIVAFFDTGKYYIPQIPIVIKSNGSADTLLTRAIPIEVRPLGLGGDMAHIKPIVREPWRITDAWPALLIFLVVLLIAYLINKRNKRKRDSQNIEVTEIETPFKKALRQLEALDDGDLIKEGKIKEHFSILSYILREYLESQFHFPALESTTYEIRQDLNRIQTNIGLNDQVIDTLQEIDMVKYAKFQPDETMISNAVENTRNQIILLEEFYSTTTKREEEE